MATFNIYLGNPASATYRWKALVDAVQALFQPSLVGLRGFDQVFVRSTMSPPTLAAKELLVYVLPSSIDSVVSGRFKAPKGMGGLTAWETPSQLTGSEVYINGREPESVAALIFHECLHNKLHLSDGELHSQGGLAGDPVNPPLTKSNVALMRRAIPINRPQWTGGWQALSDPLRGL